MSVIYKGKNGEHIIGIPARDLSDSELVTYAANFGLEESIFIEMLTRRGLYAIAKAPSKAKAKPIEDATLDETQELDDGIQS